MALFSIVFITFVFQYNVLSTYKSLYSNFSIFSDNVENAYGFKQKNAPIPSSSGISSTESEGESQTANIKKQIEICCTWGNKLLDGILTYEVNNAKPEIKELVISALNYWEQNIHGIKFREIVGSKKQPDIIFSIINDNGKVPVQTTTNFDSKGFIFETKISLAEKAYGKQLRKNVIEYIAKHGIGNALGLGPANFKESIMSAIINYPFNEISDCEREAVAEANKWKLIDNSSLPKISQIKQYYCYDQAFAQNIDEIKILAQFVPDDNVFMEDTYTIDNFEMSTSNESQICPTNNCKFELNDGELHKNMFSSNIYPMKGILRVGIPEGSGDMRYKVYDMSVDFKIFETLEKLNKVTHYISGTIYIGNDAISSEFKYEIINGTLTFENSDEDSNVILNLIAERSNAR